MHKPEHATERLAETEGYSVYRCPCGSLHVHLGAVTLRLSAESFRHAAEVMNEALHALSRATVEAPTH